MELQEHLEHSESHTLTFSVEEKFEISTDIEEIHRWEFSSLERLGCPGPGSPGPGTPGPDSPGPGSPGHLLPPLASLSIRGCEERSLRSNSYLCYHSALRHVDLRIMPHPAPLEFSWAREGHRRDHLFGLAAKLLPAGSAYTLNCALLCCWAQETICRLSTVEQCVAHTFRDKSLGLCKFGTPTTLGRALGLSLF